MTLTVEKLPVVLPPVEQIQALVAANPNEPPPRRGWEDALHLIEYLSGILRTDDMKVAESLSNAEKKIFKNTRGVLQSWHLQPVDEDRAHGTDDPEVVLPLMPKHLLVKIPGADWTVKGLPQGVYPLRPVFRVWTRDKAGNMKVRRNGSGLVPDFAGTAHSYTGPDEY